MTRSRAFVLSAGMLTAASALSSRSVIAQEPSTDAGGMPLTRERRIAALEQMADRGDPAGQFELALLYFHGDGVIQPDIARAIWWMRQAAEQGLAIAQLQLGWLYSGGVDIPQNLEEAEHWFRLAAVQGDPQA